MNAFQPQADFDRLIALLQPYVAENPLIAELFAHFPEAKILMDWDFYGDKEPNWEHILKVYQDRAEFSAQRTDGPFVFGWETMIPALEQTHHRKISISDFTTSIGTYIVFTDADKTAFIGILRSYKALGNMHPDFEKSEMYFHQGKLASYNQWFENGIWIPDNLTE
jgi:hypothetical protein